MHPVHNCHHIKSCHPPVKQYITTHHNTEFIGLPACRPNTKVSRARARCGLFMHCILAIIIRISWSLPPFLAPLLPHSLTPPLPPPLLPPSIAPLLLIFFTQLLTSFMAPSASARFLLPLAPSLPRSVLSSLVPLLNPLSLNPPSLPPLPLAPSLTSSLPPVMLLSYSMVARNTTYEFLIHIGLIKPVPTENNMSRLHSHGLFICSSDIWLVSLHPPSFEEEEDIKGNYTNAIWQACKCQYDLCIVQIIVQNQTFHGGWLLWSYEAVIARTQRHKT